MTTYRLYFENAEALAEGIALVREDLGIEIVTVPENDPEILQVKIEEVPETVSAYVLEADRAYITYGGGKARFFRALAGMVGALRGKSSAAREEHPLFEMNGPMMDCSRNAVLKPEKVKTLLRAIALMGMNSFMLYTEDTYTIPERPYFGYMRGRYTAEELRELDRYANLLGVELIPCIQFLGHLATTLRWPANSDVKDTGNVLLEGEEATYRLIGQMLREVKACFTTRKLHMGMDETHDLGQGAHEARFGYEDRENIYFRHLRRVAAMAEELGLEPMIWSDMFFRMAGTKQKLSGYSDYDMRVELPENIGELVPENVTPVFWDYYHNNEEFYAVNLEKHRLFGKKTVFAGGIWCWGGMAPQFNRSFCNSLPALEACRKAGTTGVIATVWHNGSEAALVLSLAHLALYADYDYARGYSEKGVRDTLFFATGESYDNILTAEEVEYPEEGNREVGSSRVILYNDPLIGLVDKHLEGLDLPGYYARAIELLEKAVTQATPLTRSALEILLELAKLLRAKGDFGLRLKAAYDADDKARLEALAEECAPIREQLEVLRQTHRGYWMEWNRSFGWEVHDLRYGALQNRFDTVAYRIRAYLSGETDRLEELEAERLYLVPPEKNRKLASSWSRFPEIYTANII